MFWNDPLPVTLDARLACVIAHLCRVVANHVARDRAAEPLIGLVWGNIRRRARRLEALLARFRAGRLGFPRARQPAAARPEMVARDVAPDAAPDAARAAAAALRLPRRAGWLGQLVPDSRVFASQLRHLLTDPEMAALVAASPQAGRLLRPLLAMLEMDPPPACLARPVPVATESGDGTPGRARAAVPEVRPLRASRPIDVRRYGAARFSAA